MAQQIDTNQETVHRSPPLGILALTFVVLFVASIAANIIMTGGAPYPTPHNPIEQLQAHYTRFLDAMRMISFLQFCAAIPGGSLLRSSGCLPKSRLLSGSKAITSIPNRVSPRSPQPQWYPFFIAQVMAPRFHKTEAVTKITLPAISLCRNTKKPSTPTAAPVPQSTAGRGSFRSRKA